MKKNSYTLILLICILGMHILRANPVTPGNAKNLALDFFKQHTGKIPRTVTLAYTETSATGKAVYYVFNINLNEGFVIVSAEDATRPVLGYSTENNYVVPSESTAIGFWMKRRAKEILSVRAANIKATPEIAEEWKGNFISHQTNRLSGNAGTATTMSVAPLVQSTWNQSTNYCALCPGTGSNQAITGCVATAMAQIMRYWSYPAMGKGSSSYCDCTADGFSTQYGVLSADYGATTYSWTAMPLANGNITSSNCTALATLMYHCGVSLQMNYAPGGSGSQMITGDDATACAQISYPTYFGYNAATIQGLYKSNYTDAAWTSLLENELNNGRPVQYAGKDPAYGGHSWVCDGYDINDNFHMNWGWSGQSNGYFPLNNLTTTGNFNPVQGDEALIGIEPPATIDAGISTINSPTGLLCATTFTPSITLINYGINTLTSCKINYQFDGGTITTYTWTGSLTTSQTASITLPVVSTTAGTHTFSSTTVLPNNTVDANTGNDQSLIQFVSGAGTTGLSLPLAEGFEASTNLPAGWILVNPNNDATWGINTAAAHTGTNSIAINNFSGDGSVDPSGRKDWFHTATYNFSTATTATLSFDVAYTTCTSASTGNFYADSLAVQYSTDCGTTWTQVYHKGGATLATAPTDTSPSVAFIPTSSQWRTDKITLPAAVIGKSSVMFAFENISGWAEPLYLDNINITTNNNATGISSYNTGEDIRVYPNPAHDNLWLTITGNTSSLSVTNVMGQTVIPEQRIDTAQQTQSIDISNLSEGIYFMKISSENDQPKIIRFIKN